MHRDDPLANVLHIDLSRKSHHIERREELFEQNIGGAGVAAQLLLEECPAGCDPLSADNPIVLAVGPLTGLFPLASKTVAMFKSPHTGNLGESHCGGRSAIAIRMAGYGAIVVKGATKTPLYVSVGEGKVSFRNASALWGMRSSFTVGRIIREREGGAGLRTIMRIGRAGEQLVSYASVTTETYRHFGRLGLGAVFGSKHLKAIVVQGKRSLPITKASKYRKLYDELYQAAISSQAMRKYHDLGTAGNVLPLNSLGALPTCNLQSARFDEAEAISGEKLAEQHLGRRLACSHCPVGCIHIAALRVPYEDEAYFYKTIMVSYDYEPIYALGSMLGVSNAHGLLRLMDRVETLGLDVMTTGVVLAWATEALEQGAITEKDTMGLRLAWGDVGTYDKAIGKLVDKPNPFYETLAHGVAHAASQYGGGDYAQSFAGNEMPGYHTGPATYIGLLAGARHSHLDNAGYSLDQKMLSTGILPSHELANALLGEEAWRQVLSSLVVCFFARGLYTPEIVSMALESAGVDYDTESLQKIGVRIHREKYRFKIREGFSLSDTTLPRRVYETVTPSGGLEKEYIAATLDHIAKILSS